MTAQQIIELTKTARKAGLVDIVQLQIAAELLHRGESTLISVSHSTGLKFETVAHKCAQLETAGILKALPCREAIAFSLVKLKPQAAQILETIIKQPTTPILRSKNIAKS